uniref:Ig-like domain-containing protein n=1 Tax=Acanthochromis polyacanthus TaxID=80966 RepID=A0A3Q1FYH4_9TELE
MLLLNNNMTHIVNMTSSIFSSVLLPANVLAQDQVQIQFQVDPVLVQTSTEAVFTVLTVPEVLSMTWTYQGGVTLGLWAGGAAVVNPVAQFQGRVTITATQLRIGDAVAGVSLFVPSVAVEGANVSLSCTWTAGTEITVQWDKGGSAIIADSRITISRGSLVINPARRSDAGEYTCTASNPVSAQEATQSLTVYYICLNVGEVVGIVIGSLLLAIILVVLILLIIFLVRRRRSKFVCLIIDFVCPLFISLSFFETISKSFLMIRMSIFI